MTRQKQESYIKNYFETQLLRIDNSFDLGKNIINNIFFKNEFNSFASAIQMNNGNAYVETTLLFQNGIMQNTNLLNANKMDIAIIVPKYAKVINRGTKSLEAFYSEHNFDENFISDIEKEYTDKSNDYITISKSNYIMLVKKYNKYSENPIYILGIFNHNNLFSNLDIDKESSFFIMNKNEYLAGVNKNVADKFLENSKTKILDYATSDFNNTQPPVNIKNFRVFTSLSPQISGLLYIYATPKKNLYTINYISLFKAALILIIFLIIGIIISYKYVSKIYSPIDNILSAVKNYGIINYTSPDEQSKYDAGIDEISYLKRVIQNVVNENSSIKENAEIGRNILKDKFINDLLNGMLAADDIESGVISYKLDYLKEGARVILMETDLKNELYSTLSKKQIFEIIGTISEQIKERINKFSECYITQTDFYRFGIILPISDDSKVKELISEVFNEYIYDFEMITAIGNFCTDLSKLNISYENSSALLEMHMIKQQKSILTMEDLIENNNEGYFYPIETERSLVQSVVAGDRDNAMKTLQHILSRNVFDVSSESMTEFQFAIVATIKRIFGQINKKESDIFNEGTILYLELRNCHSSKELYDKITYIFGKLLDSIYQDYANNASITLNNILKYINEHYSEDISLQDIATHFDISVSYAGKIISNHLNVGFKSYLNELRINKAKEILLSKPNIKVSDIPTMIGFNNSVTFLRVFKKHEGISPTDYIKIHNKQSN